MHSFGAVLIPKLFYMKTTMTKPLVAVLGLALCAATFTSCESDSVTTEDQNLTNNISPINEAPSEAIPGQYIVTFKDNVVPQEKSKVSYDARLANVSTEVNSVLNAVGAKSLSVKQVYGFAFNGFAATLSNAQINELRADNRIASIEPDYKVQLDVKSEKNPISVNKSTQTVPYGITRVNGGVDGTGKTAFIIDSGIDLDHPDLNVDVARSRSFIAAEPSPDDGNGHGTHVAGTVGALDNNIGVIGVAPNANVVALKVLSSEGSGATSGIIAALDYVAAIGEAGDAANMSLGPAVPVLGINSALDNASTRVGALGIGVAIAAGNSTSLANLYSPARASGDNVYTISAMDINDQFAYFSNYGSVVDYCGPGVSVYSTSLNGGYATLSGTSMATPHVCGLLLLGPLRTDGRVFLDPDFNADPIAVH